MRWNWRTKVATSWLLLLAIVQPGWGQETTVTLESPLVLVDAIVLSKKTNTIVGDLKREDFLLWEDGKKQEIAHFSREELPLSVVLLLDVSGSMHPIIDEVQRTALDALSKLKPQDKVALMIFATKAKLLVELTSDRAVIVEKLENIWSETSDVGFATFINLGIYEAARYLRKKTEPTERRAIVMITDDVDTSWFRSGPPRDVVLRELYEGGTALCGILVGYARTAMKAADYGTTAAITVLNPAAGALLIALRLLRRASGVTGSAKFYAERTGGVAVKGNPEEVGTILVGVMELLRTRYTLGYAPLNSTPDRRFREIKVSVSEQVKKAKGELVILARRGYYPSRPVARR
ncbi:MAG: VWA domain-containing protein [Blastocatellia bacterium]|nr:VWA domain-containing protein [Blastocatellia bacterium]MCS7157010.1 VWA domain-containing protein [Blastocatellia bacterium]MCX7752211.1 VWA domain-containing protein [Blastocatellia bacterium]MDW8167703.1 VWA domain-containing protein [Acidobacteriota bacterium]MDW8256302.1 VWA domain-containing protein [Acidobacteriota bacterium]